MQQEIYKKVYNIVCVTIKIVTMKLHQTNESIQESSFILIE